MLMIKRKRAVTISILLLVAIAFYLQISFDGEDFAKNNFYSGNLTKDVINSTAPQFVNGSIEANDFFSQAKLQRDIMVGKNKEIVEDILGNQNATSEMKKSISERVKKLLEFSTKETKIETLVKEKGYNDVFAAIGEDGSVDLVVRAPSLTGAEVAQVADIASRQANVPVNMVHIKNKF